MNQLLHNCNTVVPDVSQPDVIQSWHITCIKLPYNIFLSCWILNYTTYSEKLNLKVINLRVHALMYNYQKLHRRPTGFKVDLSEVHCPHFLIILGFSVNCFVHKSQEALSSRSDLCDTNKILVTHSSQCLRPNNA